MRCNLAALALVAASPLAACATLPATTVTISDDVAIRLEQSYATASRAGAAAVRAGLLDRETFRAADARAYAALLVLRSRYTATTRTEAAGAVAALEGLTDGR